MSQDKKIQPKYRKGEITIMKKSELRQMIMEELLNEAATPQSIYSDMDSLTSDIVKTIRKLKKLDKEYQIAAENEFKDIYDKIEKACKKLYPTARVHRLKNNSVSISWKADEYREMFIWKTKNAGPHPKNGVENEINTPDSIKVSSDKYGFTVSITQKFKKNWVNR